MLRFVDNSERTELCGSVLDGRYRIGRRIGIGGTGVVFEANCTYDGSKVAIKTLRPCFVQHIDLGTRLRREAEVSRRVGHPGIVKVLDEGTLTDGSPYLVMPLLYGESLSRILLRGRDLPTEEVAVMASRVATILHSAHAAGYVHRDVKPEHILFNRTATGELTVHLLDFGVCTSQTADADEKKREQGKVFGTPSYVSPEQASGQADVDGRADLFGLGIVMFEALSGRVPFSGSTVSKLLVRIIRDDAPRVSDLVPNIDPAFDLLVSRLLAREPKDRLPSARALGRALVPFTGDRRLVERRLAAMLNETSHVADTAPTVRCTVIPEQQQVA
jgi:serine/threonine protein kinase